MGFSMTACSDSDDYFASTTPLLSEGSVVTGTSDVTAISATMHGTVSGLESANAASYATGFYYGFAENALTETLTANSASEFSASLSNLSDGQVIYYQAFVTLQGRMTYKGAVKSLVTTDASAETVGASEVDFAGATLQGKVTNYPEGAKAGIVMSTSSDVEAVRAGLQLQKETIASDYTIVKSGLLPNTTYYYAAYLNLGPGVVYGDVKSFTTAALETNVDEDFVDLGLSVKWAKRNVGARTETDFGGLFGFGDVTGVNSSIDPATYASSDTYKTAADVAYVATGGKGTLPTADLFEELFRLCTTEWTIEGEVLGIKVTGTNGNSIFLPAAGKRVANTEQDVNAKGYYLTGSVNTTTSTFAVDYEFNDHGGVRATRAVYEALAVRPVTVARNIKLDKSQLYTTWHIDLRADGSHAIWDGPMYYYGTDDSWRNVTNNEPVVGDSWNWCPDYAGNSWICAAQDYGTMTFSEDGKVVVVRKASDGTETTEEGTFTVDEANKTISLTVDLLGIPQYNAVSADVKTNLRIFSLAEDRMQIAIVRDPALSGEGACQLVYNYAADKVYSGINVNLICVGNDWGGTWGSIMATLLPQELDGQHTFKYEGACNGLKVNTIDFVELKKRYPNAIVRIDDIKLDGTSIKFNANNFCYGDIENNGNFRIEMANVWGKTAKNEKIIASPFSNLKDTDNDPAFTFANSLEVTYTINTNGLGTTYKPNLITINPSWGGPWDYNDGAAFDIVLNSETAKYEMTKDNFTVTYSSADHAAGSIMTFIEIADLFGNFPGTHATLNALELDGKSISFDKTKVVDTNEGGKYRLELWNCYGVTGQNGCAFGVRDGDVIHELGFSSTMKLDFTINSLFAVPEF